GMARPPFPTASCSPCSSAPARGRPPSSTWPRRCWGAGCAGSPVGRSRTWSASTGSAAPRRRASWRPWSWARASPPRAASPHPRSARPTSPRATCCRATERGRSIREPEAARDPVSRIAYLDCSSGASGDMLLGALVDLGLSVDALRGELAKLALPGYRIETRKVHRSGLHATKVDVVTEESGTGHGHDHGHE